MTDHVKNQLCQRIEELEKEKLELNEQLDIAQQERDNYQHQFARAAEVLGEIHEALNGSGPAIVGMEAVQVRQLKGERDAMAAHVEQVREASVGLRNLMTVAGSSAEHYLYKMFDALEERPETSLARLKAQWQAEELDSLESRIKPLRQTDNGAQGKGYNLALEDCLAAIDMVRRQAEGGA